MKKHLRPPLAFIIALAFALAFNVAHATDVDDDVHKVENVVCDALSELNPIIKAICGLIGHHDAMQLALMADADGDGKPDGDPAAIAELEGMADKLRKAIEGEVGRIAHQLDKPAHKALDWLHNHGPFGHHHHHAAPPAGG